MKRLLLIVALALVLEGHGHAQGKYPGVSWTCGLDNLADGLTVCIEPAEPGMRRYVTDVIAQSTSTTPSLMVLKHSPAADGVGATPLLFASSQLFLVGVPSNAEAPLDIGMGSPLVVPSGAYLSVENSDTSGATITVQLVGYTAP